MYFFIAIVFVAELIVAGYLISIMKNFDKKVLALDEQVTANRIETKKNIKNLHRVLSSANGVINKVIDFVGKKQSELRRKIINLILINIMLVLFKTRFKKAAVILQYALLLKDFWKSIPV